MNRRELDDQITAVLRELVLCSHVPAASTAPSRSSSTDGGNRPPGDTGATYWALRYGPPVSAHPGCSTDEQRRLVLREAKLELRQLRRPRSPSVGETLEERDERLILTGEGFMVREVALNFRILEREVRRIRAAHERDTETGHRIEPETDPAKRKARAIALRAERWTPARIARLLGVHRSTIIRDLAD